MNDKNVQEGMYAWNEEHQQSRIRIDEVKCVLTRAVMEHKPEGLTEIEVAIAHQEQADWWMKEAWKTDIASVANAGSHRQEEG